MTALAAAPPLHAAYEGGDPADALKAVRSIIEDAIVNQPRSLQTTIGPSEIGTPCDHCLAAKLAGWPQHRDVAWLPYVGTCVHDGLSQALIAHENARNAVHTTGLRYLSERRVTVGQIAGKTITGSCDLFDVTTGTVIDFKVVGAGTLKDAKSGPSETYRTQVNLYGLGFENDGFRVDHVAIAYLPRNAVSLDQGIWWTAPYERARAEAALERADTLARNLGALELVSAHVRDEWIKELPRAKRCFDCPRFPDGVGMPAPGHRPPEAPFADLLGAPQ